MRAGEMQYIELRLAIERAGFPVAGNAAADADRSTQTIRMRKRKAIIEGARLREAEQKHARRIRDALVSQNLDQIEQRLMMNRVRIFRAKVTQPAEAETQWTTRLA